MFCLNRQQKKMWKYWEKEGEKKNYIPHFFFNKRLKNEGIIKVLWWETLDISSFSPLIIATTATALYLQFGSDDCCRTASIVDESSSLFGAINRWNLHRGTGRTCLECIHPWRWKQNGNTIHPHTQLKKRKTRVLFNMPNICTFPYCFSEHTW